MIKGIKETGSLKFRDFCTIRMLETKNPKRYKIRGKWYLGKKKKIKTRFAHDFTMEVRRW
jgi:hypothetical protein